jgi:predicted transcriptional regulator
MERKRSRLDIIADMLDTIIERRGEIKPTHLMYKSNLSHGQMKGYLEELVQKNLVQRSKRNDHEYIIITDEGYKFVQKIKEMRDFAEGFGL